MSAVKVLIMVVSRTDTIERAVEEFVPEVVGLILSQDILPPVVLKCQELADGRKFLYRLVDSPMEIGDSFERFENLLAELESIGYAPEDVTLDVTGGTTPMRFGAALAAMSRNMGMVHQRVPQSFVDGEWKLDPSGAGTGSTAEQGEAPVAVQQRATEGQVNRLKTIKRQMYGRALLGLLRWRFLGIA